MTHVEQLAAFVTKSSYDDLSPLAAGGAESSHSRCLGLLALGAVEAPLYAVGAGPDRRFWRQRPCALIGGGRTAPDRAAFYNGALVRYLDFNDSYPASGETCHPSDNLGAVLAAAEYAGRSGEDFLAALAVAYQVQCRLSDVAPVRSKGFDHTTQGAYAVAAGVGPGPGPATSANGQRHRHRRHGA